MAFRSIAAKIRGSTWKLRDARRSLNSEGAIEFHSQYEELLAINERLQTRNAELARLFDDLSGALTAADVPVVILAPDLRIRQFTLAAEGFLRLHAEDVGRLVGELNLGIEDLAFDEIASHVIENGAEIRREVKLASGRWFLLRMRRFHSRRGEAGGVFIGLLDIDELRAQRDALQQDADFMSAILNAAIDLLVLVASPAGEVIHINRACEELFGYSLEEVRGRKVWEVFAIAEPEESVKARFHEILSGGLAHWRSCWVAKDGRRRLISWSGSVSWKDGGANSVIGTGVDVTDRQDAMERARKCQATADALLEGAAQAILACDSEGRIVMANPAAGRMFRRSHEELASQSIEALIPERLRAAHQSYMERWFADPNNHLIARGRELVGLRHDGSEFPIEVNLSYIAAGDSPLCLAFISDIAERKRNQRLLLEYQNQLQRLTGALLSAQENANREVARELHDVFSQELAVIGMEISHLREKAEGAGVAKKLADLGSRIGRLSKDLHRASRELHPSILEELGLEAALQQECATFRQTHRIPAQFMAANIPREIPREVALCLYRVAQESLRNVQKHSASPDVRVELEGKAGGIELRIEDEGDGFDLDAALKKGGLGLISMEERLRLVDGRLNVQTEPGEGTIVTAFAPLGKAAAWHA